jgi:SEC-C motif
MTDRSELLDRYRRSREVRFRLNNLLIKTIPKKTLEECGRILGFFRKGAMVFETEDETSVLMDYCLYYPGPDGRNLVAKYLEKSPPPADSEEMAALQEMTHAYYSLFQVVDVERGVGVSVRDLLRGETGFIIDVGFGNTAQRHMMVATRIIPMEGFLTTGGAALPVDASAGTRISTALKQTGYHPGTFDFKRITPRQEAELAAIIIRECRSTGMTSRIAYAEPGSSARPTPIVSEARRIGRNDPCPCGSGKKFKSCCGRRES